jgi:hypothetical protein
MQWTSLFTDRACSAHNRTKAGRRGERRTSLDQHHCDELEFELQLNRPIERRVRSAESLRARFGFARRCNLLASSAATTPVRPLRTAGVASRLAIGSLGATIDCVRWQGAASQQSVLWPCGQHQRCGWIDANLQLCAHSVNVVARDRRRSAHRCRSLCVVKVGRRMRARYCY